MTDLNEIISEESELIVKQITELQYLDKDSLKIKMMVFVKQVISKIDKVNISKLEREYNHVKQELRSDQYKSKQELEKKLIDIKSKLKPVKMRDHLFRTERQYADIIKFMTAKGQEGLLREFYNTIDY